MGSRTPTRRGLGVHRSFLLLYLLCPSDPPLLLLLYERDGAFVPSWDYGDRIRRPRGCSSGATRRVTAAGKDHPGEPSRLSVYDSASHVRMEGCRSAPKGLADRGEAGGLDPPPRPATPLVPDEQAGVSEDPGVVRYRGLALAERCLEVAGADL